MCIVCLPSTQAALKISKSGLSACMIIDQSRRKELLAELEIVPAVFPMENLYFSENTNKKIPTCLVTSKKWDIFRQENLHFSGSFPLNLNSVDSL